MLAQSSFIPFYVFAMIYLKIIFICRSLTLEEMNILFEKDQLGMESPESLLNLIWWNNCVHFGMRGGKEHRDMKWGDVTLVETPTKSYLVYQERQTKTRQGDQPRNRRIIPPKQFSTSRDPNDKRDPVSVYKKYASHRPEAMLSEDSPYYLSINYTRKGIYNSKCWYKSQAMGVNKLSSIMKDMFDKAGLKVDGDKNVTNHSARKTMIQTLKNSKIPDTDIQQISGHANIQSLNNYNEMNMEAQEEVSNILAGYSGHLRKEVSGHVNFCREGEAVSSNVVPKSPKIPVECHSEFSPTIKNLSDVSVLDILADKSN